ncbi:PaaI family thioesterase [Salicibibacter halophilus]|uniref:PaaI family thioesterase n=1 Tax=Salicibibacter halophilus TaxID=2502791 RepID=A0A514LEV3_9BACI|nr:PaaI family thioesterase [Salicibibacter halophilus]QDI90333.1 PaaI family thioesterase [Salicibibacter halophilus]
MDNEYLTWLQKDFEDSPFWKHMGISMDYLTAGEARIKMPVSENQLNCNQYLHGGSITSLLDSIIGVTIRSSQNVKVATIYLNTHFVSPVKDGTLYATANVVHPGKSIIPVESKVVDDQDRLIAFATSAFTILKK